MNELFLHAHSLNEWSSSTLSEVRFVVSAQCCLICWLNLFFSTRNQKRDRSISGGRDKWSGFVFFCSHSVYRNRFIRTMNLRQKKKTRTNLHTRFKWIKSVNSVAFWCGLWTVFNLKLIVFVRKVSDLNFWSWKIW